MGTQPRWGASVPLEMRSQRAACKQDRTLGFSVWERKGSNAGYQIGLRPELTQPTPRQGGLVRGSRRPFTS